MCIRDSAGTHTQTRGAVQGAERNLRAGHSDFTGNGRRRMEEGGRVEGAESGGCGVGAENTAYARTAYPRSRAGTDRRRAAGGSQTRYGYRFGRFYPQPCPRREAGYAAGNFAPSGNENVEKYFLPLIYPAGAFDMFRLFLFPNNGSGQDNR